MLVTRSIFRMLLADPLAAAKVLAPETEEQDRSARLEGLLLAAAEVSPPSELLRASLCG